jgi:Galactose oxidase, central domain
MICGNVRMIVPVMAIGIICSGSKGAAQTVGYFSPTGSLVTARQGHTATLLSNGKVLLAGGISANLANVPALASAELYDPSTGTFVPTGSMASPRASHTATLLPNGSVLIAGGYSSISGGGFSGATATVELYDPDTGKFSPAGKMSLPRFWHSATLLKNGKVLIAGGYPYPPTATAEMYDPTSGAFTRTGSMTTPRSQPLATLLADGRVLIVPSGDGADYNSAEIYDPDAESFHATNWANAHGMVAGSAAALADGKVLLTLNLSECDFLGNAAESYDSASDQFTDTSPTLNGTCQPTATLLSDGTVLIAAGWFAGAVAQVYDPTTEFFLHTADPATDRHDHTATLLLDGSVLIAGGSHHDAVSCCAMVAAAEIYHPASIKPAARLLSLSGDGTGPGAIQHGGTYTVVSGQNPAVAGEVVVIYCTGLLDGGAVPPQVAIADRLAPVLWFGNTPGYPGLNQINVRIPDGVAQGSAIPVWLNYLGRPSAAVSIAIAASRF